MLLEVLVRFWYFLTLQVYLSFVYAILTLCAWILEKAGWAAHRRADCRTQSVDKAGPSLSSQQPANSTGLLFDHNFFAPAELEIL